MLFCLQFLNIYDIFCLKGRIVLMKEILDALAELEFIDTDECYECKDDLRDKYALLSHDERRIYKWYFFYQLCILKYPLKNALWEYINGKDNGKEVELQYAIFCEKRAKYKVRE